MAEGSDGEASFARRQLRVLEFTGQGLIKKNLVQKRRTGARGKEKMISGRRAGRCAEATPRAISLLLLVVRLPQHLGRRLLRRRRRRRDRRRLGGRNDFAVVVVEDAAEGDAIAEYLQGLVGTERGEAEDWIG